MDEQSRHIRQEADAVLASDFFQRSPVMTRLLRYLIDQHCRLRGAPPKAYHVATEALGRDSDFDPATDSYPRVMVSRLRQRLDRHYAPLSWEQRLWIPLGGYEIALRDRVAVSAAEQNRINGRDDSPGLAASKWRCIGRISRHGRRLAVFLLLLAFASLVLLGGAASILPAQKRATIGQNIPAPVLEISFPETGGSEVELKLARRLESQLRRSFLNFDMVRVRSGQATVGDTVAGIADYRLSSAMTHSNIGPAQLTLVLDRLSDQRTIWSTQLTLPTKARGELDSVSSAVSQLAGDYGEIVQDRLRSEPASYLAGFPCLAQYNRYRHTRDLRAEGQIDQCLRISLQDAPNDPALLSALSFVRFAIWQRTGDTGARTNAEEFAKRAGDEGVSRASGLFALARAAYFRGDCVHGSRLAVRAVQINPYDADIAGYVGVYESACGNIDFGEKMLRRSIDLDGSHSALPTVTLAFLLAERGQNNEATSLLDRLPSAATYEMQFLLVKTILAKNRGDVAASRSLWAALVQQANLPADAPAKQVLQQFITSPAVQDRAITALGR